MDLVAVCLGVTLPLLTSKSQETPRRPKTGEGQRAESQAELRDRLRPGMTAAEVRKLLGLPTRTARQILYRRYLEQWSYDDRPGVCIEFDCHKGDVRLVSTVHIPAPAE